MHSPDLKQTLKAWSSTLHRGGLIILIDDYRAQGVDPDDEEVILFQKSWLANSVPSTTEIAEWAEELGMQLIRDRDLGSEYQILKRFYRNKKPTMVDDHGRVHQVSSFWSIHIQKSIYFELNLLVVSTLGLDRVGSGARFEAYSCSRES